jgi:hypothetical protein
VTAGQAEAGEHAALVAYCRLVARGLDRLDEAGRQALVRKIVTRIVAYPDRVELDGAFPIAVKLDGPPESDPSGSGRGQVCGVSPSGASHARPSATRRGRARASSRARRSHAQYTRRPRRSQRSQ